MRGRRAGCDKECLGGWDFEEKFQVLRDEAKRRPDFSQNLKDERIGCVWAREVGGRENESNACDVKRPIKGGA